MTGSTEPMITSSRSSEPSCFSRINPTEWGTKVHSVHYSGELTTKYGIFTDTNNNIMEFH